MMLEEYPMFMHSLQLDFIVNELKPAVDKNYRTLREKTFMAGISLGGLITTYAACCHPDVFTRVAGISSGFYRNQEEIENLLRRCDLSSIERFYLDCGTQEGGADQSASREFASSNMRVYEILKTKVSNTKFQIVEGAGHNYQTFRERIPEIFSFLLNDG
jgi:predicted alpha/beta superfamily hydrolase